MYSGCSGVDGERAPEYSLSSRVGSDQKFYILTKVESEFNRELSCNWKKADVHKHMCKE